MKKTHAKKLAAKKLAAKDIERPWSVQALWAITLARLCLVPIYALIVASALYGSVGEGLLGSVQGLYFRSTGLEGALPSEPASLLAYVAGAMIVPAALVVAMGFALKVGRFWFVILVPLFELGYYMAMSHPPLAPIVVILLAILAPTRAYCAARDKARA